MKIKREPAMAAGVVTAVLALLVAYGVLDAERATLWEVLLIALLPVVQGFVTRHFVVPVSKLDDAGVNMDALNRRAG